MLEKGNARRGGNPGGASMRVNWNNRDNTARGRNAQDAVKSIFVGGKLAGRVIGTASRHLAFRAEPGGLIQVGSIFADQAAAIRAIMGAS